MEKIYTPIPTLPRVTGQEPSTGSAANRCPQHLPHPLRLRNGGGRHIQQVEWGLPVGPWPDAQLLCCLLSSPSPAGRPTLDAVVDA